MFEVVVRMDILEFGILIEDEFFCLVCGVYVCVVPEGGESFVVVGVEVGEKVMEGALWKGFTEVEIVYDNICVCNYARHSYYYRCSLCISKKRAMSLEKVTIKPRFEYHSFLL